MVRVAGDSMWPALAEGDVVVVDPTLPARLGDIAVFDTHAGPIVHRVVGRGREAGDNLAIVRGFRPEEVWGRVVAVRSAHGTTEIRRGLPTVAALTKSVRARLRARLRPIHTRRSSDRREGLRSHAPSS